MRKVRKPKDPDAPKRPQCSYFIFMNERRPIVRKKHSDKTMTELTKLIAVEWNNLDDKTQYIKRAAKLKERYKIELEEYKQTSNYRKFERKLKKWKIYIRKLKKWREKWKFERKTPARDKRSKYEESETDSDSSDSSQRDINKNINNNKKRNYKSQNINESYPKPKRQKLSDNKNLGLNNNNSHNTIDAKDNEYDSEDEELQKALQMSVMDDMESEQKYNNNNNNNNWRVGSNSDMNSDMNNDMNSNMNSDMSSFISNNEMNSDMNSDILPVSSPNNKAQQNTLYYVSTAECVNALNINDKRRPKKKQISLLLSRNTRNTCNTRNVGKESENVNTTQYRYHNQSNRNNHKYYIIGFILFLYICYFTNLMQAIIGYIMYAIGALLSGLFYLFADDIKTEIAGFMKLVLKDIYLKNKCN